MDGQEQPSAVRGGRGAVVATASVPCELPNAGARIQELLGPGPFALVAIFAAPNTPVSPLLTEISQLWNEARVIGCTTAGEIAGGIGYVEDSILALAFPSDYFRADCILMEDLQNRDDQALITKVVRGRARLGQDAPEFDNEFAFLLVDGLSMQEDHLASAIVSGLGTMPMFGGSAGDGIRFESTQVFLDGKAYSDAAVLTLLRTNCELRVFSLNHFEPTDQRMVVTGADPTRRVVHEINAEPAALELARLLGKAPEQIDTFTFAENPMVVRFGAQHHVRAIKRVTEQGDLEFFSAIDEGLVLTIAEAAPLSEHLRSELQALAAPRAPSAIIACDCLLRRIEAQQKQVSRDVSNVLAEFGVTGFSTYGEQIGGMHVNQTMTGVALYAPEN